MVQVQKDFSRERQVRFRNYGIFPAGSRFPKAMRRVLHKSGIAVELTVLPEKTAGLMEEECADALRKFFRRLRSK